MKQKEQQQEIINFGFDIKIYMSVGTNRIKKT